MDFSLNTALTGAGGTGTGNFAPRFPEKSDGLSRFSPQQPASQPDADRGDSGLLLRNEDGDQASVSQAALDRQGRPDQADGENRNAPQPPSGNEASTEEASSPGSQASTATEESSDEGETPGELTESERDLVQRLQARDREVRTHEQAHLAAAGDLAIGGPTYDYQRGPDGKRYAVGGEVQIDTSAVPNDPEATLQRAQRIKRAALAPAEPSSQDRRVAAKADQMANQARRDIAEEQFAPEEARETGGPSTENETNTSPTAAPGETPNTDTAAPGRAGESADNEGVAAFTTGLNPATDNRTTEAENTNPAPGLAGTRGGNTAPPSAIAEQISNGGNRNPGSPFTYSANGLGQSERGSLFSLVG